MVRGNEIPGRTFAERAGPMPRLGFHRLIHMPLLHIMVAASTIVPAMALTVAGACVAGLISGKSFALDVPFYPIALVWAPLNSTFVNLVLAIEKMASHITG